MIDKCAEHVTNRIAAITSRSATKRWPGSQDHGTAAKPVWGEVSQFQDSLRRSNTGRQSKTQGSRKLITATVRGRCIMVMPLPSKQESRVRFPPPAPDSRLRAIGAVFLRIVHLLGFVHLFPPAPSLSGGTSTAAVKPSRPAPTIEPRSAARHWEVRGSESPGALAEHRTNASLAA
jgi:hypothetical protein